MKIFFAVLLAFTLGSCAKPKPASPPPPDMPVIAIRSGSVTTYQQYPASIEGKLNVEIRPQVSGTLDRVFVDEGAYVKSGQSLFKINDQPFVAALNNAKANLHGAQAALVNAQLEIEKLSPLVQNKVVSEFQLKTATASADVAKANVEQAKANLTTAQINLGYTLIKAPVDGYIGRLLKKQGSLVGPSNPESLTLLSDVDEVHVYFALSEKDFVDFKAQYAGNNISEKLKALPQVTLILNDNSVYPKSGRIDMIDGQFSKTTGAITARATFVNTGGLLRSGNTGRIKLGLLHRDALIVPQTATMELQDQVFVFAVADSNKVKKIPLKIVGKDGTNYLISEGVKAGDRIVLSGFEYLQEGAVINPKPQIEIASIKK